MQSTPATPGLSASPTPSTPCRSSSYPVTPSTPRRQNTHTLPRTPKTPHTPSPLACGSKRSRTMLKIKTLRLSPRPVPFRIDGDSKRAVNAVSDRLRAVTHEHDLFAPSSPSHDLTPRVRGPQSVAMKRCCSDPVPPAHRPITRKTQSMHFALPRSPRMYDLASCI